MKFKALEALDTPNPIVDLPIVAIFLNPSLLCIRLFLQVRIDVESTKEIPLHSPKQRIFKNGVMGYTFDCINKTKGL